MSKPQTYIDGRCQIGQRRPCGREATHAVAVFEVTDRAYLDDDDEPRDGGVVRLCEYHATTPASEWEAPA